MLLLILSLSFYSVVDEPVADAVFPENCADTRLRGKWKNYYVEYDGGDRYVSPAIWSFSASTYSLTTNETESLYSYEIDRSASPLRMTTTYITGNPLRKELLNKQFKTIYKFEGGKLWRCLPLDGDEFPSSFETTKGDNLKLQVFVRETTK